MNRGEQYRKTAVLPSIANTNIKTTLLDVSEELASVTIGTLVYQSIRKQGHYNPGNMGYLHISSDGARRPVFRKDIVSIVNDPREVVIEINSSHRRNRRVA